jgi:hypothetical protein
MPVPAPLEIVATRLAEYLGPHTARVAIKTFSTKVGHSGADPFTSADVGALLEALRPMLRTLLGRERAEQLLATIQLELR